MKKHNIYININKDIFLDYFIRDLIEYYNNPLTFNYKYVLIKDGSIHLEKELLSKKDILIPLINFKTQEFDLDINPLEAKKYNGLKSKELRSWIFSAIPKNMKINLKEYNFKFKQL